MTATQELEGMQAPLFDSYPPENIPDRFTQTFDDFVRSFQEKVSEEQVTALVEQRALLDSNWYYRPHRINPEFTSSISGEDWTDVLQGVWADFGDYDISLQLVTESPDEYSTDIRRGVTCVLRILRDFRIVFEHAGEGDLAESVHCFAAEYAAFYGSDDEEAERAPQLCMVW